MKRVCDFLMKLAAFAVASAVTATKGNERGKNKDMRLTLGERQILSQLNMDLAPIECLFEF